MSCFNLLAATDPIQLLQGDLRVLFQGFEDRLTGQQLEALFEAFTAIFEGRVGFQMFLSNLSVSLMKAVIIGPFSFAQGRLCEGSRRLSTAPGLFVSLESDRPFPTLSKLAIFHYLFSVFNCPKFFLSQPQSNDTL
jgi:hypothetical protein